MADQSGATANGNDADVTQETKKARRAQSNSQSKRSNTIIKNFQNFADLFRKGDLVLYLGSSFSSQIKVAVRHTSNCKEFEISVSRFLELIFRAKDANPASSFSRLLADVAAVSTGAGADLGATLAAAQERGMLGYKQVEDLLEIAKELERKGM